MSIGRSFLKSKRLIAVVIIILAASILLLRFFFKFEQPRSVFLLKNTRSENIREEYRQASILKPESALSMPVVVGSKSLLTFGLGVPKNAWEVNGGIYTVIVEVRSSRKQKEYKVDLSPASVKADRRWKDYSFDLSDFRNQQAQLSLRLKTNAPEKVIFVSQIKLVNQKTEVQKPNVLLITIDTLRKDHLSTYAYERKTSPFLDSFSRDAAVFTKAITAAPLTVPSITSIMTSTYYSEHGVKDNRSVFDQSRVTLAEIFRRNMYSTAAFVGNAVLRKNRNLDKGFDVYNCLLPGTEINRRLPERNAEQLTTAALTWLKSHKDQRWFLWLHYQDPHAPYMPPPPYDRKFKLNTTPVVLHDVPDFTGKGGIPDYAKVPGVFDLNDYVARYDGEVLFVDKEIGRFLKNLSDYSLMDHTIIAVTSDHGESLGENEHYFAHGHNVTPELVDVPLMLRSKNINPEMIHHRVSLVDLPTTLLKLTGIQKPTSFRGTDLFVDDSKRVLFSEQPDKRWAAFKGNDEIIYEWTGEFHSPTGWNDGKKVVDQWIQQNFSGGLLLRFSGFNGTAVLKSEQKFKRIYLTGGETQDRISASEKEASIILTSSGSDEDFVFVEPAKESHVTITSGNALISTLSMDPLPTGTKQLAEGISVTRIKRKTPELNISPEQAEELKSLGYTSD